MTAAPPVVHQHTNVVPAVDGAPFRLGHVAGLDGVRGIAVLLVVAFHASLLFTDKRSALGGGVLGVEIFFTLSGFLITALLLEEFASHGRISLRNFWWRRACRLFPALGALLIFHLAYVATTGRDVVAAVKWVATIALYVANIGWAIDGDMPGQLQPTWSLAVEEQFYVLWPVVVAVCLARRRSHRLLAMIAATGAVLSVVARAVLWETAGFPAAYVLLPARADGILIGAFTAIVLHARGIPRRDFSPAAWSAVAVIGIGFLTFDLEARPLYWGGLTFVGLATSALIIAVVQGRWRGSHILEHRALTMLGKVSYGIYIWHVMVQVLVVRHVRIDPFAQLAVFSVGTAVVTALSWYAIERPFLRFKTRFRASA